MSTVNSRLKEFRKAIKLTQQQISSTLGISQPAYAKIERGQNNLTVENLAIITDRYDLNASWLISGKGKMFISENELEQIEQSPPNSVHLIKKKVHLIDTVQDKSYHLRYRHNNCNLLLPAAGRPGYLSGWTDKYISDHVRCVKIPGILGRGLTVEISAVDQVAGLAAGEWLCCVPAEDARALPAGAVCVVTTTTPAFWVAYTRVAGAGLELYKSDTGKATPELAPWPEIKEVWLAHSLLTTRLPSADMAAAGLPERLGRVERFLSIRYPDWKDDLEESGG